MEISRKRFIESLASGTVLLLIQGCGGDDDEPPPPSACGVTITNNHGHVLTIASADLSSTTSKTYDIQGTADHTHNVTLSPTQLAQLKSGGSVSVTSTQTNQHSHPITISACTA
jgi:hypothetical protein